MPKARGSNRGCPTGSVCPPMDRSHGCHSWDVPRLTGRRLVVPTRRHAPTRRLFAPGAIGTLPMDMDSKKLAQLCRELAENKKAEDVVVLDVRKVSDVTDYYVIATASSEPQLRAVESEILDTLARDHHIRAHSTDGTGQTHWIVADFFDVIVHVMRPETRAQYDLEGLWSDAPRVPRARKARKSAAAGSEA